MSLKVENDQRKCGMKPAPRKTTVAPRIVSDRTRRTLWNAMDRAEGADRNRISLMLTGAGPTS